MNRQMRRQIGMPQFNPRDAVMQMMQQPQFRNNKVVRGLIQKMEAGDEAGVIEASRNIFRENNQNFDEQFRNILR